jgi:hypothetical protein
MAAGIALIGHEDDNAWQAIHQHERARLLSTEPGL